jgi:hypothetical protein
MPYLKTTQPKTIAGVQPLLTTKEAAEIIGLSASFLHNDRYVARAEGTPPKYPYVKLPSGGVRYRVADLLALIEAGVQGA